MPKKSLQSAPGMQNSFCDVRLLTLMRWNLPQKKSIRTVWSPEDASVLRYVSFQNYHFIDVTKCGEPHEQAGSETEPPPLSISYDSIRTRRTDMLKNDLSADLHIQQSITLLGKETTFWQDAQKKNQILYVTLIKLRTQAICSQFNKINEAIARLMKDRGYDVSTFTLYAAMDYCDLVLFVKDIPCTHAQSMIWQLLEEIPEVMDTITLSCFAQSHIKQALEEAAKEQIPERTTAERGTVALTADVSICNLNNWKDVEKGLKAIAQCEIKRISGRSDMRLRWEGLLQSEVYKVIFLLDNACQEKVLGGYELIPLLTVDETPIQPPLVADTETAKNRITDSTWVLQWLCKLSEEHKKAITEITPLNPSAQLMRILEMMQEIYGSLQASMRSGFTSLFVFSVLPSLETYTKAVTLYVGEYGRKTNAVEIDKRLHMLGCEYVQALNTLAQCTMHGEQQFVQAPSFNCTAFDVPPRLLALYSGLAFMISRALNDDEDRHFSFLISPDTREDIFVKPITMNIGNGEKKDTHPYKLCIISLNERLFYRPDRLSYLLCHEIAHHVGNQSRYRRLRAQKVAHSIAMYIVCKGLCFIGEKHKMYGLAQGVAEALGNTLLQWYDDVTPIRTGNQYFLKDLSDTLLDNSGINAMLMSGKWTERLEGHVKEALKTIPQKKELEILAGMQDDALQASYTLLLYQNASTRDAAVDLMAHGIVVRLQKKVFMWHSAADSNIVISLYSHGGLFLQAHLEAFSDLCMVELLKLSVEIYESIVNDRLQSDQSVQVQLNLRKQAIEHVAFKKEYPDELIASDADEEIQYVLQYARQKLAEYLEECKNILNPKGDEVQSLVDALEKAEFCKPSGLLTATDTLLEDYRKKLFDKTQSVAQIEKQ